MAGYTEQIFLDKVKKKEYGEEFNFYELHGAIVPISDHVLDFYRDELLGIAPLELEKKRIAPWVKAMLLTKKENRTLRMLFAAGDYVKQSDSNFKTNIEEYQNFDIYVSWPESYADPNSGTPQDLSVMANFDFLYRKFFQQKIMVFMDIGNESHRYRFHNLFGNSLYFFASLEQRIINEKFVWPLLQIGGLWARGGDPPPGFINYTNKPPNSAFPYLFEKVALGAGGGTRARTYKKKLSQQTKTRKQFYFNPKNPKKSFNVYINKNPKDTIPIHYKSVEDVKDTIQRLERLYKKKKYSHKRIWQVGMIMKVRLHVVKDKKPEQYALANRYFQFLSKRTELPEDKRYSSTFKI